MPSKKEKPVKQKYHHILDNLSKQLAHPLLDFALSQLLKQQVVTIKDFDREFDVLEVKKQYVDYLGKVKVIDTKGQELELLIHLEFQSQNDPNMLGRMLEYAWRIYKKHGDYPLQVLIYFGEQKLNMERCYKRGVADSFLHYCFYIIDISSYSPEVFLKYDDPKMKLLAGFTLKTKDPRAKFVLEEIIKGIVKESNIEDRSNEFALLEFLSKKKEVIKQLREVIETFEVRLEDLPSYQEGLEKGIEKGLKEGAVNTIIKLMKKKYRLNKEQEQEVKKLLESQSLEKLDRVAELLIEPITLEELIEKIKQ